MLKCLSFCLIIVFSRGTCNLSQYYKLYFLRSWFLIYNIYQIKSLFVSLSYYSINSNWCSLLANLTSKCADIRTLRGKEKYKIIRLGWDIAPLILFRLRTCLYFWNQLDIFSNSLLLSATSSFRFLWPATTFVSSANSRYLNDEQIFGSHL